MSGIIELEVTADHAVPVTLPAGGTVTVLNQSGDTLYYADNPQVSAASNQGTLTATNSATFSLPQWVRSASLTTVQVTFIDPVLSGGGASGPAVVQMDSGTAPTVDHLTALTDQNVLQYSTAAGKWKGVPLLTSVPASPDGLLVAPVGRLGLQVESVNVAGNKILQAARVICPKAGHLRYVSVWIGTGSGNAILAVYDTGDALAGSRSLLGNSGSVASTAGTAWLTWDPGPAGIAVSEGQHLDLVVMFDNATVSWGYGQSLNSSIESQLPANFLPCAGGALPKYTWQFTNATFVAPPAVTEAQAVAVARMPLLIAMVV